MVPFNIQPLFSTSSSPLTPLEIILLLVIVIVCFTYLLLSITILILPLIWIVGLDYII